MAQVRGSQMLFTLFEEDTFGQDPAVPDGQKIYCTSFGLKRGRALHTSQTINGDRGKSRPVQGVVDASGPISMELSAHGTGTLLKHIIGDDVTTTGADPYQHIIKTADLPIGMTIEKDRGTVITVSGRYEKFNGVRAAGATWRFAADGFAVMDLEMLGATSALSLTPLDATVTDNLHVPFSNTQLTIEEGGVAIAYVESVEINLSSELDTDTYVVGSSTRRYISEGDALITGTITALFESMDLLTKARDNTASSLKCLLSRGDGLGSSGNESIEFLVPNLDFEEVGEEIDGPGGVSVTFPFQAYKSGTDLGMQITLKNAVATI